MKKRASIWLSLWPAYGEYIVVFVPKGFDHPCIGGKGEDYNPGVEEAGSLTREEVKGLIGYAPRRAWTRLTEVRHDRVEK
jgi:hypothetical protein